MVGLVKGLGCGCCGCGTCPNEHVDDYTDDFTDRDSSWKFYQENSYSYAGWNWNGSVLSNNLPQNDGWPFVYRRTNVYQNNEVSRLIDCSVDITVNRPSPDFEYVGGLGAFYKGRSLGAGVSWDWHGSGSFMTGLDPTTGLSVSPASRMIAVGVFRYTQYDAGGDHKEYIYADFHFGGRVTNPNASARWSRLLLRYGSLATSPSIVSYTLRFTIDNPTTTQFIGTGYVDTTQIGQYSIVQAWQTQFCDSAFFLDRLSGVSYFIAANINPDYGNTVTFDNYEQDVSNCI